MKKTFFVLTIACLGLATIATAQLRSGGKVGLNLSSASIDSDGGADISSSSVLGRYVGTVVEYSFTESFALQPELVYLNNGGEWTSGGRKQTLTIHQLQLPINAKYKYNINNDFNFFGMIGPYVSLGVGADLTTKEDGNSENVNVYKKADGADKALMSRFDLGGGIGVGVGYKRLSLQVGYQYGLLNLSNMDGFNLKMNNFSFGLGYFFY